MRARSIRGRQENDNTRPFAMLTGEAYHHIVQSAQASFQLYDKSRHARYLVCYSLEVMYKM